MHLSTLYVQIFTHHLLQVLVYLMVRVVVSMSRKRASLANVGRVRQLYYEVNM